MKEPPSIHSASREPLFIRRARGIREGGEGARPVDVLLEGGRIRRIAPELPAPAGATTVDAEGLWLLSGWIDLQVNDIAWISLGLKDPREHAARIRRVAAAQASQGVTGFILTTLAAPEEEILAYLKGMKSVLDSPAAPEASTFLGGLVEGTFMNPAHCGAHNAAWVRRPERALLDRLIDTGAVRLINIAPETSPDAIDLIAHATSRGVVVGAGHAKPHAERLREAADAGLRYVIHLGNGPTGSSLKAFRDGGMLEESLRNDNLTVTIILDGVHIHPQLARDWMERKEVSRVIAISDSAFAGDPPPKEFKAFGVRGALSEDGRYLKVVAEPSLSKGALAARGAAEPEVLSSDFAPLFGSAAGMKEVFATAVNILTREMPGVYRRRHPALSLEEGCFQASRMTSANPAALLGLSDRGALREGLRADLVLVELQGAPGDYTVAVRGTFLAGP